MKKDLIEILITVITGLSGGAAGLYLFWKDKGEAEKVTRTRAGIFIGLGICGAYFLAPIIIEYFSFKGGVASGVSFLCAVFTDAILFAIYKIFKTFGTKAGDVVEKILNKYLS